MFPIAGMMTGLPSSLLCIISIETEGFVRRGVTRAANRKVENIA